MSSFLIHSRLDLLCFFVFRLNIILDIENFLVKFPESVGLRVVAPSWRRDGIYNLSVDLLKTQGVLGAAKVVKSLSSL